MKLNIQLFSGSCSIREITETTDIDTNASTFTITARLSRSGTTHNNDNAYMQLQWKYASSNNWTSLSKQSFGLPTSVSYRDRSWTLTLTHNADGTLENINFRVKWYITDSTNGTTGATTFTPTTIPRKSDIQSITSGTTDYAPTLTWTPASSTFKFIIRYLYGSWTYQTDWITPNSTNQQTFNSYTITGSSLAPYMTNTTTASVLASLYTYTSDGQLVGDSNVYFNVALNNNIEPSVSFNTPTEAGDTPSNWGVFVKTKSKLNLQLTASGIYGSTITGYRIEGNGYTYTDNPSVSNYLTTAGTIIFSGSVTDSRGRQKATSTSVYVEDYTNPTISTAQVQRCDENGNIDNNGEYCYISYGASISSCANKNKANAHYKVGYRVHNSGDYTYISLASNVNSYSATGILYTDGIYATDRGSGTKLQLSNLNTYDIIFYVDDTFNLSGITNTQTLDTGFDLINFNPSGKAMAIGKVSEAGANEELLEIGMNTNIIGTLAVDKIDYYKGLYFKENGYGDKFKIVPYFSGVDDSNALLIQSAVGGAGTDPALDNIFAITALSGNIWNKGTYNANNGFYSKPDGNVDTQTPTDALVIKRATYGVDNVPNTGVVLEYGRYNGWGGQLFIPDNIDTGIYYNGWSNGVRGTWKKLAFEEDTGWINLATSSNFESYSWGQLRYRKKNGIVTIVGVVKALVTTGWLTLVANLPDGFRPPMEYNVVCRTSRPEVMKLIVNEVGEIWAIDTSAGTYLQPGDSLEIAVTYIAA